MTFEFKPTNNFFSDFGQSLKDNLTDFNLTFDGTGSVATVIETFTQKLSESNGTVASMFIATSNWFQGVSDYYRSVANTAAEMASLSGSQVQAGIADAANNLADRYAINAEDAAAEAISNDSKASIASVAAEFASTVGNAPRSAVVIDALQSRADHPSDLVREHVTWALARHGSAHEK